MTKPVKFAGKPDGPSVFIKEFGHEVPTFSMPPSKDIAVLKYHVPLEYRGDFKPTDLADYDSSKEYRVNAWGKVLCYAKAKSTGERCNRKAVNRFPRCTAHGGRLHPLDLVAKDDEVASDGEEAQSLSRYRQFQAGQITVDDLDDEELACCGFRSEKDGRIFKPRNIPRSLADAFTRAIYERAEAEIRSLAIDAAHTIGEIMKTKTNEPDIRLKAAITLIERNLGKTPQVISVGTAKPFETVFDSIQHVRSERVNDPTTKELTSGLHEEPLDAEVVSGEQPNPDSTNDTGNQESRSSTPEQPSLEFTDGSTGGEDNTDVGSVEQPTSESSGNERPRDARLYSRNQAILAQTLEIKPFEYDVKDRSKQIKHATQKRFASRVLGVDLTKPAIPLVRHRKKMPDGTIMIRHTMPEMPKIPKAKQKADTKRKMFTLNDFD